MEAECAKNEQTARSTTLPKRLFQPSAETLSTVSSARWTGSSSVVNTILHQPAQDKAFNSDTAGQDKQNKSMFLTQSPQTSFSMGPEFQKQGTNTKEHGNLQHQQTMTDAKSIGKLVRPMSPTQQCSISEEDRSHFSLALMECEVGCQESEDIFRVQKHEMVCAMFSQTQYVDGNSRLVASLDIGFYWCNFCPFSTPNKSLLIEHVVEHRFHCKHCCYQSFSRADVFHHTAHAHPHYQDSGIMRKYCALLSDYLRIQQLKENEVDLCHKRRTPTGDDDGQPSTKVRRTEGREELCPRICEDFDTGSGHIEEDVDTETTQKTGKLLFESVPTVPATQVNQTSTSEICDPTSSNLNSFALASVSSPASGGNLPSKAQAKPPVLGSEAQGNDVPYAGIHGGHQNPDCSSQLQTPPVLNSYDVDEKAIEEICTNTYFGCGYCKFTSSTKSGIEGHCGQQHKGRPLEFVSLMKLEDRHTPPVLPFSDNKMECAPVTDQNFVVSATDANGPSKSHGSGELKGSALECDEPPVLVKQEPLQEDKHHSRKKVRFPSPHIHKKHAASFKCYHCEYRARFFGPLRSHILDCHKGKCLVGLGGTKSRIFMCAGQNCTFRSWSGQKFLSHARTCTPWTQSEAVNVPEEPHLVDCLHATMCLAEVSLPSSATVTVPQKLHGGKYSCLYCKNQFISSKRQTKRHVLKYHGSECLLMRNVHAHSKRRRSSVFFCRWCPWEGERKADHDLHAIFCIHQGTSTRRQEEVSHVGDGSDKVDNEGLEGNVDLDSQATAWNTNDAGDDGDDVNSLEPPDIVHDQEHLGENNATHKADDISNANDDEIVKHVSHGSVAAVQEDAAVADQFLSHVNVVSSDNVVSADSIPSDSTASSDKAVSAIGSGLECLKCDIRLDSLGQLRDHMQKYHSQHVSFPFRSVYHKEKHNKSKFYACPFPECSVYMYSEADTVHHYRLHHSSQAHPYLDPSYSPAPVVFRRRSKPCNVAKGSKPSSALRIPHVQVDANEKPFLCLYCDKYFYTDTVSEMKAHHLFSHPGQAITVRDVKAFRYKKASRLAVCDQPLCDFTTYKPEQLAYHVAAQHSSQPPEMLMAERSFQCVSCGWITTDDSIVQEHVSMMHEGEGGATVVTLAHGDDQGTVEERFICASI